MKALDTPVSKLVPLISTEPNYKYVDTASLFNFYQYYKKILVFDLRGEKPFSTVHFFYSINLPYSSLTTAELINYNGEDFTLKHFKKSYEKELFKQRKRLIVFIIPSNGSISDFAANLSLVDKELNSDPNGTNIKFLKAKRFVLTSLLYKALKSEKIRELYILQCGFRQLLGKYPFLCLFHENKIYLEP